MRKIILLVALLFNAAILFAQEDSAQHLIDSLESTLTYEHGDIKFDNIGTLSVPTGFRYLNASQAQYVLQDLWGNPQDTTVLGLIVPEQKGVLASDSWAFIVTYEAMGYVKDDDADDIDYDEMLEQLKTDQAEENKLREQMGYDPIEVIGWASQPYYDKEKKVLHWAKALKFGDNEWNTLNYNVRVLGRKGVMVLNAVSGMEQLKEVQENIDPVLSAFSFADGLKYDEFDPELDEVAAWTIGGLVAGKVLAKAGIFALFLKYIKVIILGIGALGTAAWKWFRRKTELPEVRSIEDTTKKS
jgi:uncharacterized membrane-anchored protein